LHVVITDDGAQSVFFKGGIAMDRYTKSNIGYAVFIICIGLGLILVLAYALALVFPPSGSPTPPPGVAISHVATPFSC